MEPFEDSTVEFDSTADQDRVTRETSASRPCLDLMEPHDGDYDCEDPQARSSVYEYDIEKYPQSLETQMLLQCVK